MQAITTEPHTHCSTPDNPNFAQDSQQHSTHNFQDLQHEIHRVIIPYLPLSSIASYLSTCGTIHHCGPFLPIIQGEMQKYVLTPQLPKEYKLGTLNEIYTHDDKPVDDKILISIALLLPNIKYITFNNCQNVTNAAFLYLLQTCTSLESLTIKKAPHITFEGLESISFNPRIQTLILEDVAISKECLIDIGLQLMYLKSLHVAFCQFIEMLSPYEIANFQLFAAGVTFIFESASKAYCT